MSGRLTCGVDEAGRGPLAGPVYAAAVILDPAHPIAGLADSKLLSRVRRERLALQIKECALAWSIASATVEEIDTLNILRASLLAMRRAVVGLSVCPEEVLVDGVHCPEIPYRVSAVIRGDASVPAISAASILAKCSRDVEMLRLHGKFPQYGFDRHKGYPTPAHLDALQRYGVCEVYRRSFGPVKRMMAPR